MIKCSCCNKLLLECWFYKRKGGLFNVCKECISTQRKEKYIKERSRIYDYAIDYYKKNRRKQIIKNKKWRKNNRDKINSYHRNYFRNNKEKLYAHCTVLKAIKKGLLIRPNKCEKCGIKCKPDGHHYKGYAKENRLNVQWLCKVCHSTKYFDLPRITVDVLPGEVIANLTTI